jgi:putative ABC transport system permease protein
MRQMMRAPGFTLVAVLTLALGIGANTAIFSIVNAVLLRPLPYEDADRLVQVWSTLETAGLPRSPSSLPDYRDWRSANRTFAEMGAYFNTSYTLSGNERPERLQAVSVTSSLWQVLRTQPTLGRVFGDDAEQWGQHLQVVLSHSLWRRRFGADPAVIGTTIRLDDRPYVIIGVMPPSFQFPNAATEIWTPAAFAPDSTSHERSNHFVNIVGRLNAGIAIPQAQADLAWIAERMSQEYAENAGLGVTAIHWQDAIVGDVRSVLWLLLGGVGVVVLIACANVANLLLARASSRWTELGIRVALGAGRSRLLRQLLTESFVLAGVGALLGVALAYGLMHAIARSKGSGIPRVVETTLDGTVLVFTAALTLITALVFGLWPAWQASIVDANQRLNESTRGSTGGRASMRVRGLLIVAEVSGSLVLLVAAALLMLSLLRVQRVDPGFRSEQVLTLRVSLPSTRYDTHERIVGFVEQMSDRLTALPGVSAAGTTTALPLAPVDWGKYLTIEGRPAPQTLAQVPLIRYRQVAAGYFAAFQAPLRQGRLLSNDDRADGPLVAVINESAARRFWPDANPIGARVALGPPDAFAPQLLPEASTSGLDAWRKLFPWITIVGVIGDFRHGGLDAAANPELFVPFAQGGGEQASPEFYVVVRSGSDPMMQREAIEAAVHSVDPAQAVADVMPMTARLADSLARRRFTMTVFGAFGALALALALIGLYGVLAYAVGQRRKELGIRAALGADPHNLSGLVVAQGMRLAVAGVAIGLPVAALLSRLIERQLFNVAPVDPAMYAAAAAALLVCATLACWIPSRRAARVDPVTTLRES